MSGAMMGWRTTPLPPDWDAIRAAVLRRDGGRCTSKMKDGTRCRDRATDVDRYDVWIIDSRPTRSSWAAYRQANARHVTCDPGQHEVTRRATTGRPAWVLQLIADWYQ